MSAAANDGRVHRAREVLGDAHNFGRRVVRAGDALRKPRTVYWEWQLLSARSPLRRALAAIDAAASDPRGVADFLPDLRVARARSGLSGTVAAIELAPLRRPRGAARLALAHTIGRAVALYTWLGLGDLHWENLALGADARGRVVFAPLDVELALADLELPTETQLVPAADPAYGELYRHAAGLRRVLPFLGRPLDLPAIAAIVAGYHATLVRLDRHAREIAGALAASPGIDAAPIRVMLRSTGDYVTARVRPDAVWPPLLEAEREQLARGDVPYFFQLVGQPGIRWFRDRALRDVARLPLSGDVPRAPRLLSLARGLRSPSRRRLREEGAFTLVGALDHPALSGAIDDASGVRVAIGRRVIALHLPGAGALEADRDLRAHVGSLYLPCACGEARTVLAPPPRHA